METDGSVSLLPIFKEKICDCIGIVCKMDAADRVQAVQFWNQVSLRLQTVLDRTVNVTVHSISSSLPVHNVSPSLPVHNLSVPVNEELEKKTFFLDLQDKDGSCQTKFLINKDISISLIPPSQPVKRPQSNACLLPTSDNTTHEQSLQTVSLIPISGTVTLSEKGKDTFLDNINEKQILVEQVNSPVETNKDYTDSVLLAEQVNTDPVLLAEQVNTDPVLLDEQVNTDQVLLAEQVNTDPVLLAEQVNTDPVLLAEQVNTDPVLLAEHSEQVNTVPVLLAEQVNKKLQGLEDDLDHNYHGITIDNKKVQNGINSFQPGQTTTLETSEYNIQETVSSGQLQPVENDEDVPDVDDSHGEGLQMMELAVTDEGHIVFDNSNEDNAICDTISTQIIIDQDEESEIVSEFKCIQCSLLLSTFEELANHSKIHNKPFVCESCHQGFTTKGSLTVHKRRHNGDKPYKCDSCDQTFSTPGNLKRHSRIHTGEKPFSCAECQAKFTSNKNLKSHMLIHSGEKPFSCTICNAKFTQSSTLKSHIKIHTEDKPFTCDICNKSFVQKSNMTSHRIRHSIERNFGCDFCQNRFHTKADLMRHACSHLAGAAGNHINLFPCGMCNKSFSRNYLLNNHTHKEHKKYKSWQCILCKYKFFSRSDVVEHLLASRSKAGHQEALHQKDINKYLIQNQFILNLKAKITKMELSTDIPPD